MNSAIRTPQSAIEEYTSTLPSKDFPRWCSLIASQITPPFRGGIPENCQRFRFIGSGYDGMPKEQDGHFMLSSARQCAGPMRSLTDDMVEQTNVIGATQVLKSLVGDCWVPYVMEHVKKSMIVYFEDDPKADLFCSRRLMDTIRGHPTISKLLEASARENRHNIAGTWIKFIGAGRADVPVRPNQIGDAPRAGAQQEEIPQSGGPGANRSVVKKSFYELLVCGLNDGNASTLEWEFIWISEGWQHATNGLIKKAIKRADHFPQTRKILCESQASVADTDLHEEVKQSYPVPLTWACPHCGGRQTWEWHHWNHKRPDDFQAKLPIPTIKELLDRHGAGAHLAQVLEAMNQ